MKWFLFVLIASCIGIVGTSADEQEPIHEVTCWEVLSSNSCGDQYGGIDFSFSCRYCTPNLHKCVLNWAQEYDSAEWDIGRGVVVPSLNGNGFGNAVGEEIVCYSTSTCLDDCRPIVGGGFECEVDATTDFVVYDETAWGDCE